MPEASPLTSLACLPRSMPQASTRENRGVHTLETSTTTRSEDTRGDHHSASDLPPRKMTSAGTPSHLAVCPYQTTATTTAAARQSEASPHADPDPASPAATTDEEACTARRPQWEETVGLTATDHSRAARMEAGLRSSNTGRLLRTRARGRPLTTNARREAGGHDVRSERRSEARRGSS